MRHSHGFTLLELLVVLVILGLGAAVATPSLVRLADKLDDRNKEDQLTLYLQGLPVAVMKRGGRFVLPATEGYVSLRNTVQNSPVLLPEGNSGYPRIWVPKQIEYRPNGACTGGTIYWELSGGERFTHELKAPVCRPRNPS